MTFSANNNKPYAVPVLPNPGVAPKLNKAPLKESDIKLRDVTAGKVEIQPGVSSRLGDMAVSGMTWAFSGLGGYAVKNRDPSDSDAGRKACQMREIHAASNRALAGAVTGSSGGQQEQLKDIMSNTEMKRKIAEEYCARTNAKK